MDFHFTNQFAHLSLSNGEHLRSCSRPVLESPEETKQAKHYFELELNFDPVCEQEFLQLKEAEFPEDTQVCASLLNFDYPYADLVEVEKEHQHMKYTFSVTLIREHWQHKVSLYSFIPEFIHALNKNNLKTELEFEEAFGCYLTISLVIPTTNSLRSRIKTISKKISNTQQRVLLEMGE